MSARPLATPCPRPAARMRVAVLSLAMFAGAFAVTLAGSSTPAGALPDFANDMLAQVNAFRAANGRGPLAACDNLMNAAQGHAADMAARNYFDHTSPEGGTFVTRAAAAGYTGYTQLGENIAKGYDTVTAVMLAWEASPGHLANLLGPGYNQVGFGLATAPNGTKYWVQDFGANGVCGAPFAGNYESLTSPWPQTARASGWVLQTSSPSTSLNVDIYVDGGRIGRYPANKTRNDVAGAHPGAGSAHGFDATFNAGPGGHTVCVYAIGTSTNELLGCRFVALASASPIGSFDSADSPAPGVVHVRGWTFDPETVNALAVHIYVDGGFAGSITANKFRQDLANAYPTYGGSHAFDNDVLVATGGNKTVCAYAINQFLGDNALLGCRGVAVTNPSPQGSLDGVDLAGPRRVTARGWALDAETANPISVDVYVDGAPSGRYTANSSRPDVGNAFPGLGANHGYSITFTLAPGAHNVCTYGINAGARGSNSFLGCKSVTVPSDPQGSVDGAARNGGTITGNGWVVDPDTNASINVHVYVDGQFKGSFAANQTRNDIAAAFPFFGAAHGFSFSIASTNAPHQVCVYGINTGAGGNALISCRNV